MRQVAYLRIQHMRARTAMHVTLYVVAAMRTTTLRRKNIHLCPPVNVLAAHIKKLMGSSRGIDCGGGIDEAPGPLAVVAQT